MALEIPFNMDYVVMDDFREVPSDYGEMREGIEFLKSKCEEETEKSKKALLFSMIGVYLRLLMELEESEKYLIQSFEAFKKEGKTPQAFAVKIKLAATLQWGEHYTKCDKMLFDCLAIAKKSKSSKITKYLDSIYEGIGKSYLEQERYKESLDAFMKSFEIKLEKGDLSEISKIEKVIAKLRDLV